MRLLLVWVWDVFRWSFKVFLLAYEQGKLNVTALSNIGEWCCVMVSGYFEPVGAIDWQDIYFQDIETGK